MLKNGRNYSCDKDHFWNLRLYPMGKHL